MIKYCIVNRETRAIDYGIGTYSSFLIDFVKSNKALDLVILHLYRNLENPRRELIDGTWHIYLSIKPCLINFDIKAMLDMVFSESDIIFHFNHLILDEWGPFLKKWYPSAKIICTVHYLSWYYSLMGNKDLFYKVINSKGADILHPNSRYTYQYYLKNACNFKYCDIVIALCNETYKMLIDVYGVDSKAVFLIPNGIKPLEYPVERLYKNSTINIIYVGRIDEIKGIYYLAKAYKIIKNKYKNTRLHLIGDAENPKYLDQCLSICPEIIYHGRLSHKELDLYYRQSDIGVIPSFHEQCSYSLLEMMAYRLPIVGTNATGINEMLSPTPKSRIPLNLAFKDELKFVEKLVSVITRYICDPMLRKTDSSYLYDSFYKNYTLEIFHNNMRHLFNNICKK